MKKKISVVLPAYNEEAVLPEFHQALSEVLGGLQDQYRFHIIYVLDRSSDRSLTVLRELASHDPRVTVLHLSKRFGHQMSLVAGIDYSDGDAVVMMDCDLQHPPAVIPQLLAEFENGYQVVHAVRRYNHDSGYFRRLGSDVFYKLQNALSPIAIEAGSADFRLISRRVANLFTNEIREQNQFLRGLFRWVGFSATSVQFESQHRTRGSTKYHVGRLLTFSIQGITSFSKVPLRIAAVAGFILSMFSLAYGGWIVIGYFAIGHVPEGYTSLIAAIMFIGGLQLLVLGVLGEYLGSIFDEVKKRPLYLVDEIVGCEAIPPNPNRTGCSF